MKEGLATTQEERSAQMKMQWKNWFTTVSGLIAGLPQLINAVAPIIAPKYAAIISAIGAILVGLSAKDFNVTGK